MKVPLLDLKAQYVTLKDEIMAATEDVYLSQYFILGPVVEDFEKRVAEYCDCKYAIGVSSGTDALLASLMAAGVKRNDRVITTPYTFFATVGSICRLGAVPFMVDIDEKTYNLDPELLKERVSSLDSADRTRLKAVIPVHLYGQCAEMEPIMEVATNHDLVVIEDAAQALGAECEFKDSTIKRAGSIGQYGCFSFFPSKNLGAFGDGGMITTDSREIYDRLKILRVHGAKPKYYHKIIGGNFRLDALQAAILLVKLKYLDEWTDMRIRNANQYRALFEEANLEDIILPLEKEKRHIYNQFVIRYTGDRDALKEFLNEREIGCEIYYPVPLHMQECFRFLKDRKGDYPVSEKAASETLALPIYPELNEDQINYVVETVKEYVESSQR